MMIFGQTYKALWKQVEAAQDKDLPQTTIKHLRAIEQKALREKQYGHLMKATLLDAQTQAMVAPDSLQPAVQRLEEQAKQAPDGALQAVYAAVLSKVYADNPVLGDDAARRSVDYRAQAFSQPDLLAHTAAGGYEPFVIPGVDSKTVFGGDLLSLFAMELRWWELAADYYRQNGPRRAACIAQLELLRQRQAYGQEQQPVERYIQQLDSLAEAYADLGEACEIAIERYSQTLQTEASEAERAAYLRGAIQRWGSYKRSNVLRNYELQLTQPQFAVQMAHNVVSPGVTQSVQLNGLRHLSALTMRVYRTQLDGTTTLNPDNTKDCQKIKTGLQELPAQARQCTFAPHPDYETFSDSLQLGALEPGVYLLEFEAGSLPVVRQLYFVSDVALLVLAEPGDAHRLVAVSRTTGQPLGGATVSVRERRNWNADPVSVDLTTDAAGETRHTYTNHFLTQLFAYTPTDRYCPQMNGYGRYAYYENRQQQENTALFTDRALYRPGQTVHVAAIAYTVSNGFETKVVSGKQLTIQLKDANGETVAKQEVTTDEWGKCAARFTIPSGRLSGTYAIRAAGGYQTIRVEEYKRPTFQVEFDDYKDAYQAGDTITATARATSYAGVPVQGGRVKYCVKRRVAFWWMSYSRYWGSLWHNELEGEETLAAGETVTQDDGAFEVAVPLTLPIGASKHPMFYHFVVEADVTDLGGETHSGLLTLPLGSRPTALTCNLDEQVRADQIAPVTFSRKNAAGQDVPGTVSYRIDGGAWRQQAANEPFRLFSTQPKSGQYRLEATCGDDSLDIRFVVFGLDDRRPATETPDWFYVSDAQFPGSGQPVTVQVGSSDENLHIVYAIFAGKKTIESGVLKESRSLWNRKLTYKEEYGDGLLLTFAWVKQGVTYTHSATIRRPLPDKDLKLQWSTFRDRLTPGQQEEWTLSIIGPDGKPAAAQLTATLYDQSLDQLAEHSWALKAPAWLALPQTSWQYQSPSQIYGRSELAYTSLKVASLDYTRFDGDVFPSFYRRDVVLMSRSRGRFAPNRSNGVYMDMAAAPLMMKSVAMDAAADEQERVELQEVVTVAGNAAGSEPEESREEVQLRQNLDETAFFYPALVADKNGNVALRFTLPESLTTWRFIGLAHTKDLCTGVLEGEAIAQKDVMIQPNVPRFVRVGDEAQLMARIFNTGEQDITATACIELLTPDTEQTVYTQRVAVSVKAGETGSALFSFRPDNRHTLLICKVSIAGEGFSDGEQHYLPVLPDCEYVTRTVPFTQHQPGVKSVDLQPLFPEGTSQQKLTIEYTNNPAWLMIQSLPTLGQPWEKSAIEQAAAYYSNTLAMSILAQNPSVRTVFEQWKRETGGETSLQSSLEKDEELKNLLLAETPWVAAADRESEQKQRLADFFDVNGINARLALNAAKLAELQGADGAWSWYPGMPGSLHITVAVSEMLVRLNVLTSALGKTQPLLDKAFGYMGREMVELVETMKREEHRGHKQTFPSFTALRWLYLCALDGRQLPAKAQAANSYLTALLKKEIKNQSLYEKALTAVILSKHGESGKAAEYVESLRQYSVYTEEMGRYYDTPRAGYSWFDYKIPTEVAAIEAIQAVAPSDLQTLDEMRRWLLQEKRTQTWDTPVNSVNAIYAFLFDRQTILGSQEPTALAIDGQPLELPQATAGIGYVKTTVSAPQGRTFTASKTSTGTSWGALYAQFMQKTSEIAASQSGITVKRELIGADQLHVGDRLKVRITIETTRDLDFVQLVDSRAACMEPVNQLSGYRDGAYCMPKDCSTNYYFGGLSKGKHVIETEYYIDRAGRYETGICTVQCAYAPEFHSAAPSVTLNIQ
ncbi:MAG: alpha-2-macroglobulin [Prevotella sp.]|nr:alpha-2-macroglobulin [Prevotella sp.]